MLLLFHLVGSSILCCGGTFTEGLVAVLGDLWSTHKRLAVGDDVRDKIPLLPSFWAVAPVPWTLSTTELPAFLGRISETSTHERTLVYELDGLHCDSRFDVCVGV